MSSILNHTITKIILSSLLAGLAVCVILMPEHLAFIQFCNHYANQIMLGYLLMGLLFLALRQKELMTLSFACCVALCLYLKLAVDIDREGFKKWRSGDQIQVESKPAAFTVAHFNLAAGTSEKHILEGIRLANADLVSIQEIRPDILQRLKDSLQSDYLHQYTFMDIRMLGMGIFAKKELQINDPIYHDGLASPCGWIQVGTADERLHFVSTNTLPALTDNSFQELRKHLTTLALHLDTLNMPVIALGDFNAAPWSNIIREFELETQMKDSRDGFMSSFTAGSTSFFGAPLNHIFYSDELRCKGFETVRSPTSAFSAIKGLYEFKKISTNAKKTN